MDKPNFEDVSALDLVKMVEAFHVKYKLAVRTAKLGTTSFIMKDINPTLAALVNLLRRDYIDTGNEDTCRLWLILKEFSELVWTMIHNDKVGVLDATTKMLYYIFGLAVTHDLDIIKAFCLMHHSNMTKSSNNTHAEMVALDRRKIEQGVKVEKEIDNTKIEELQKIMAGIKKLEAT